MELSIFFNNISSYLAVFFTAMTPIGELRASIPLALGVYNMNIFLAYAISIAGNIIPAIAIIWILEPLSKFLMKRIYLQKKLIC